MKDRVEPSNKRHTTADAMLEALQETGVSYLFCNLGSDHPAIIEGLAKAKAAGRPLPEVIICPHESVALSAAHGYALLTRQAQGVIVHTDVGTQNLGGTLHNAFRGRIPVFIFAGETPYTMDGELPGSRNIVVNSLQNVYDQRGIVRGYVKWEYDIRTGKNVKQLIYRAMQMAHTEPAGPVYLTGAREVLEEDVPPAPDSAAGFAPVEPISLSARAVREVVEALAQARHPLVITSHAGKNGKSVEQLVKLCERLAVPVIEHAPSHLNFPGNHPLHLGYQPGAFLPEADVILVLDSDVPWIATLSRPKDDCKVYYIDTDPIKEDIPLWVMPSEKFYRADIDEALQQLNDYAATVPLDEPLIGERYARVQAIHDGQREAWRKKEVQPDGVITPEWLTACIRQVVDDEAIIVNETITNVDAVWQHLPRSVPGTFFNNGGSSLGWSGGASLGVKLADRSKTVVCLSGDGSYLFSVPSSVHWVSRRYNLPFLTVIYNNQGWNATKKNMLSLYPDGVAKQTDRIWVNFEQPAELANVAAAAGGAYARTVERPEEVEEALRQAMAEVKNGRSAVLDVRLAKISNQTDS